MKLVFCDGLGISWWGACVVGIHWDRLAEAIVMDTCSMCFCRKSGRLSFVCRRIPALSVSLHMILHRCDCVHRSFALFHY